MRSYAPLLSARHPVRAVVLGVLLVLTVVAAQFPGSQAAFTARLTNSADTLSSGYFSCTAAAVGDNAFYAYPLDDALPTLLSRARDVSGNGLTYRGTYPTTAAHSTSSPCRDGGGSLSLNGSTNYVTTPFQLSSPQTFTTEIWFRTTVAAGYLTGFQQQQTGNTSNSYDRHVYLTSTGQLSFGVYNFGYFVATSPAVPGLYNNGAWHYVAASLGPAGMKLYLDGKLVATNANTVAEGSNGYWRVGSGKLDGWPGAPGNVFFAGQLGYFGYYQAQLSDAAVAAHYAARA